MYAHFADSAVKIHQNHENYLSLGIHPPILFNNLIKYKVLAGKKKSGSLWFQQSGAIQQDTYCWTIKYMFKLKNKGWH